MKNYMIVETIPRANGERVWCVNKKIGESCGCPDFVEIFRGAQDECEEFLKNVLSKEEK